MEAPGLCPFCTNNNPTPCPECGGCTSCCDRTYHCVLCKRPEMLCACTNPDVRGKNGQARRPEGPPRERQ
jgi:hypothetical protein